MKWQVWTCSLAIAAICAFGAYSAYELLNTSRSRTAFYSKLSQFSAPEVQVKMAQYERKVYPYSIIQGGIRSREELSANIRADKVVAKHYANFDVSKARIIKAPEARAMYVSYRLGDKVYWTAKKINIPQGETLITDGTLEARTRCGNMLSDTEMTPLSGEEPDAKFFDVPQVAKLDSHGLEPVVEPGLTPLSQFSDEEVAESPIPLTGNFAPARPGIPGTPLYPSGPGGFLGGPTTSANSKTPGDNTPPGDSGVPGGGNPITPGVVIPGGPGTSGGPDDPGTPGGPDGPDTPGVSDVPEPSTMVMVLTGLAAVAANRIRRRKQ